MKIEIIIGGFKDFKKTILSEIREPVKESKKILFLKPSQLHALFSEKRLELLEAISEHPDSGVVELARLLKRKQEAISRDLAILKAIGVIPPEGRKAVQTSLNILVKK